MITVLLATLSILGWATIVALATAVVLAIRWTWQDTVGKRHRSVEKGESQK